MAYTTFAVFASSMLIMMLFFQVSQEQSYQNADAERIGKASFFLESLFSDMDRSLKIATRRGVTGVTNEVIVNGESLNNFRENISEAVINGSLDGKDLNATENASLNEWSSRVSSIASESGYELNTSVVNYTFSPDFMTLETRFEVRSNLYDPTTFVRFNRSGSATVIASYEDLEDTMILLRSEGRYPVNYRDCGFNTPANMIGTGSQNSTGYVQGDAVVNPSSISSVSNKSEKIVVATNIDSYSKAEVESFAGAVSDQTSSNTPFSNKYVFGVPVGDIESNKSIILNNNQVWEAHFRQMLDGCYVPDENGPDFLDRLENNNTDSPDGLATMIKVDELPPELTETESAIGHEYFSNDSNSLSQIRGVTGEYSWFRLDEEHIDYWGLNDLKY